MAVQGDRFRLRVVALCWYSIGFAGSGLFGAATLPGSPGQALTIEQITDRMAQADQQRRASLPEFSVVRKYVLKNSRMKQDAEMLVRVSYSKEDGKTFQVMEAHGTEGMAKRVFQHLMDAEKEASRSENQQRGTINSRNYTFDLLGSDVVDGHRCYVLALRPKTKTKYLFNGQVWVDADAFAIVRLEGHPAASISFWVGKPLVVQTWQKTGEFWMAATNRSKSESRLLGLSELTVQNTAYQFGPLVASR